MSPPSLIIFDCDGVLVDSEPLANRVLHRLLVARGIDVTPEATHRRFLGTSATSFTAALLDLDATVVPDEFLAAFRHELLDVFSRELRAVEGAAELVASLDVPYCVASNSSRVRLIFSLRQTGLFASFEGRIFSAEDVPNPKPAPDLFLHAAESMGVGPGDCLVIEDTSTGVRAARAAGMRVLGYTPTVGAQALLSAGAHRVFDRMDQCPPLAWPRTA